MATSILLIAKGTAMPPPHQFTLEGFLRGNDDDCRIALDFAWRRLERNFRRIPPDDREWIASWAVTAIRNSLLAMGMGGAISHLAERGHHPVDAFWGVLGAAVDHDALDYLRSKTYKLKLYNQLNCISESKNAGISLVIVALISQVLFFRVFDQRGRKVCDSNERAYPDEAARIEDLRVLLRDMWPADKFTMKQTSRVIEQVRIITNSYGYEGELTVTEANGPAYVLPPPELPAALVELKNLIPTTLNVKEQQIIALRYFEHNTFQQIADIMQVPKPTVIRWHEEALEKLKRAF
jgi:hypothetical protein